MDIYFSPYINQQKLKKIKPPKKIYKSGRRVYDTTTKGIYFLYTSGASVVTYVGRSQQVV